MSNEKIKTLAFRFLRGGVAGALGVMVSVIGASINTNGVVSVTDLKMWIASLAFAGITGFVSGGIMALDKYFRM